MRLAAWLALVCVACTVAAEGDAAPPALDGGSPEEPDAAVVADADVADASSEAADVVVGDASIDREAAVVTGNPALLTGTSCAPGPACWSSTLVGTGTLNRLHADKSGALYVGNGDGYFTNATGAWVHHDLPKKVWAIDPNNGVPHTLDRLTHSWHDGTTWQSEPIPYTYSNADNCTDLGPFGSNLAFAPDGTIHALWTEGADCGIGNVTDYNDLVHASRNASGWTTTTVGGTLGVTPCTLAVDELGAWKAGCVSNERQVGGVGFSAEASGVLHVGFRAGATYFVFNGLSATDAGVHGGLFVAPQGASLPDELTCGTTTSSEKLSIAVDDGGKAHVVWVGHSGQGAFYATNASGSWVVVNLDLNAVDAAVTVGPSGQLVFALQIGSDLYIRTLC